MAKELPYYQFEPQEYLSGDVSFCSLSAQGLFNHICSHYWTRSCKLTKKQVLKRLNEPQLFDELVDENVIKWDEKTDYIAISFLDEQFSKISSRHQANRENGKKGGRPKKPKKNPTVNPNKSQSKGIREDKIKEDDIILDDNKKRERAKRFAPPSIVEVEDVFFEKGVKEYKIEAEKFWHHYESKNWYVGKNKMKNWKSAAAGWVTRMNEFKTNENARNNQKQSESWEDYHARISSSLED